MTVTLAANITWRRNSSQAVDSVLDMFRTVVNVCGDSPCCLFLNDPDRERDEPAPALRQQAPGMV
jgi:Na+/H+-dicarboxylate symporter